MLKLPLPVKNYVEGYLSETPPAVCVLTDQSGNVTAWEGDAFFLNTYSFRMGDHISDIFDFMYGILPFEDDILRLPDLRILVEGAFHAHILKIDEGYAIILTHSEPEDRDRQTIQQFANETACVKNQAYSSKRSVVLPPEVENRHIKNSELVKIPVTILAADIHFFSAAVQNGISGAVSGNPFLYLNLLAEFIFEYEGHIETLLGERLTAIFGLASSETHPADQVLSCVSRFISQEEVEEKGTGVSLFKDSFRMGIASGDAVIGHTTLRERRLFHCHGACISHAENLMQAAGYGEIMIDFHTFQAAERNKTYFKRAPDVSAGTSDSSTIYKWNYGHGH